MISIKKILGKITNRTIFEQTGVVVFDGSISGGNYKSGTVPMPIRNGYKAIGINGHSVTTRFMCPNSLCIQENGEIGYLVYNPASSTITGTLTARILWQKVEGGTPTTN